MKGIFYFLHYTAYLILCQKRHMHIIFPPIRLKRAQFDLHLNPKDTGVSDNKNKTKHGALKNGKLQKQAKGEAGDHLLMKAHRRDNNLPTLIPNDYCRRKRGINDDLAVNCGLPVRQMSVYRALRE